MWTLTISSSNSYNYRINNRYQGPHIRQPPPHPPDPVIVAGHNCTIRCGAVSRRQACQ